MKTGVNRSGIFAGLVLLAGFAILNGVHPARAQEIDDRWSEPVNLSESGSANNPQIIVISDDQAYITWNDFFAGPVYSAWNGEEWTEASSLNFPFEPADPQFVPDNAGSIHAFWIEEDNDLMYSQIRSASFGNSVAWQPRRLLAQDATTLNVEVDSQGNLHLVYIRALESDELVAGVYYRRSISSGLRWSNPVSLFDSPYLRMLTPEDANLQIASGSVNETDPVYVTWDLPSRKRVFLIYSEDGGDTWFPVREVDGPYSTTGSALPVNIQVHAMSENVLLIWQVRQEGVACTQFFQWSPNSGRTWSIPKPMLEEFTGCPEDNQIVLIEPGLQLLLTTVLNQSYLMAWNGTQWSEPQIQEGLPRFDDPDTLDEVDLECHQLARVGNALFLAGCEDGGAGDAWWTAQNLVPMESWFPPPSAWRAALNLEFDLAELSNLRLTSDPSGQFHAFWSFAESEESEGLLSHIQYALYNGELWFGPTTVLQSPEGRVSQFDVAADPTGRLMIVWSTDPAGELYFSWANASQASSPIEWAEPTLLPSLRTPVSSPDLFIDAFGITYVSYTIPLNEDRGVYLVRSTDGGDTWSDPVRIFDAVEADWDMVDQSRIARNQDGSLHALWTQSTLPGGEGPIALYYGRSEDNGEPWTISELVIENRVLWSQIVAIENRLVHRIWRESIENQEILRHQVSLDNGITWSQPENVTNLGQSGEPLNISADPSGQLHLVLISEFREGEFILQHWRWNGETWTKEESRDLERKIASVPKFIDAMVSRQGQLAVLFYALDSLDPREDQKNEVFFTRRDMELPEGIVMPVTTVTPAAQPTPIEIPTLIPTLMPTPTFPPMSAEGGSPGFGIINTGNDYVNAAVGGVAASLLVIVAFIIGLRIRKS